MSNVNGGLMMFSYQHGDILTQTLKASSADAMSSYGVCFLTGLAWFRGHSALSHRIWLRWEGALLLSYHTMAVEIHFPASLPSALLGIRGFSWLNTVYSLALSGPPAYFLRSFSCRTTCQLGANKRERERERKTKHCNGQVMHCKPKQMARR